MDPAHSAARSLEREIEAGYERLFGDRIPAVVEASSSGEVGGTEDGGSLLGDGSSERRNGGRIAQGSGIGNSSVTEQTRSRPRATPRSRFAISSRGRDSTSQVGRAQGPP